MLRENPMGAQDFREFSKEIAAVSSKAFDLIRMESIDLLKMFVATSPNNFWVRKDVKKVQRLPTANMQSSNCNF